MKEIELIKKLISLRIIQTINQTINQNQQTL